MNYLSRHSSTNEYFVNWRIFYSEVTSLTRYESLCPMCHYATLGIKERFFGRGHQEYASHPFGVPLTELLWGFLNQPTTFVYSASIASNISSGTVAANFLRRLADSFPFCSIQARIKALRSLPLMSYCPSIAR